MTLEEKIGQLFINLNNAFTPEYLDHVLENYHVGGMRFRRRTPRRCRRTSATRSRSRRSRCSIASNPEMGGFGSSDDGTLVCTHLQAGSHPDRRSPATWATSPASRRPRIGCNWAFAPIVDIHYNWRNTVIATRAFGNTPEVVIERAKEYFDGISESKTVCAIKHFPGDGIDERDQHVVTS